MEGTFFTFSKEYWQLAMTRQNWKTQKSLKQPWFRSTKPKKETRKAMKTATRFSKTSWFLREDTNRLDSVAYSRFPETDNDNNQKFAGRFSVSYRSKRASRVSRSYKMLIHFPG